MQIHVPQIWTCILTDLNPRDLTYRSISCELRCSYNKATQFFPKVSCECNEIKWQNRWRMLEYQFKVIQRRKIFLSFFCLAKINKSVKLLCNFKYFFFSVICALWCNGLLLKDVLLHILFVYVVLFHTLEVSKMIIVLTRFFVLSAFNLNYMIYMIQIFFENI